MDGTGDKSATKLESAPEPPHFKARVKGRPVVTVKCGSARVPIYRCQSGKRVRFVISYYRSGRRQRQSFRTVDAAKKEAQFVAQRIQAGLEHVTDIKPHERDAYAKAVELLAELDVPLVAAVEDYLQARKLAGAESLATMAAAYRKVLKPLTRRVTVPEVVEELLAARSQDGVSKGYLRALRHVLHSFAAAFPGEILGVSSSDIDRWLREKQQSGWARNSKLSRVKVLFSFARSRDYLPADQRIATDTLRKVKVVIDKVDVFSPGQLQGLLHAAPAHLVPVIAMGAFAGIRMAELARLDWSAVDLDRGYIEVRATQAKTGSRRIIPVTDNLRAWLAPLPRIEKADFSLSRQREVHALARSLGLEWPRNVLRHSFISYRIAIVKSADQVALEAGNSPAIIFKHYRELTTEEQANEWFGIVPKEGQWDNPFNYDWRTRTVKLPGTSGE